MFVFFNLKILKNILEKSFDLSLSTYLNNILFTIHVIVFVSEITVGILVLFCMTYVSIRGGSPTPLSFIHG